MRDKVTKQCPQATTFEEKGEPKWIRNWSPFAYQSKAKPAHLYLSVRVLLRTVLLSLVILNACLWPSYSMFWKSTDVVYLQCLSTLQPCTSLQCHFIWSYTRRVHVCLAVTSHVPFWQNDWDLLCATVVTPQWNWYKTSVGAESAGTWACDLTITLPSSSLSPSHKVTITY